MNLAEEFADPPTAVRPHAYWWLPGLDSLTPAELERDVEQVADAGINGLLPFREDFAMPPDDSQLELLEAALRAAKARGITVDISLAHPARTPAITPDSGADQQELVYGTAYLAGGETFKGPLPVPPVRPEQPRQLVAVVAARCANDCQTEKPVPLDQGSLRDLTGFAHGEEIEWTAPTGSGQWVLLSFWSRSARVYFADEPYASHLGTAGAEAITNYLEQHTLTPAIEALLRDAGGVLNENSLHMSGFHLWSPDFLREFRKRRGYSLRKYLPVSIIANLNDFFNPDIFGLEVHTDSAADFDFAGDAGKRIRNDYFQTLSELYEEYLLTLQEWANAHGLEFQAKVGYGQSFSTSPAAKIDVPMTEEFQLGNTMDGYRSMSGNAHMGGRDIVSSECCPQQTGSVRDNYGSTWKHMLAVIHNGFAGGVTEVTLHGFTHADAPEATWPGYTNSDGFFAEEFGPRQPYWHHMPELMDFLGREQLVLREGRPQVDVAVYRQSFWDYGFPTWAPDVHPEAGECQFPEGCLLINDKTLERAGYTYEYIGPDLLDLPGAKVRDERLSPDGPAYKALVIHQGQRNIVDGMPLDAARKLLDYARRGLPVVVVGGTPSTTGFLGDASDDSKVRRTMERLLDEDGVRTVAHEGAIADALADLGVQQAARPEQASNLLSLRRIDRDASLYFLWNQNRVDPVTGEFDPQPEGVDHEVSFEGRGQPFALNAWTGEISPIATYEREGNRITIPVKLDPGQSTIIAIGPRSWQRRELEVTSPSVHATKTTAHEAFVGTEGELRIRATSPGTYTTELSDGRSVESMIGELPGVEKPAQWHLSVEDWQPGASATETNKVQHELDLDSLRTWPEIPGLEDVSGIGRYTTELELGPEWAASDRGAQLKLGPLFDSVRLWVNGAYAGYVDPDDPVVDVSDYLQHGTNEIEVEVATTLRNRVRTVRPAHARFERQPYGLVGPVRLVPYGEAVVEPG